MDDFIKKMMDLEEKSKERFKRFKTASSGVPPFPFDEFFPGTGSFTSKTWIISGNSTDPSPKPASPMEVDEKLDALLPFLEPGTAK